MTTNHEKYLAGEPLTPELEAIRRGREPGEQPGGTAAPALETVTAGGLNQPLSRAERVALREMRASDGWGVLQKLLKRATLLRTETATKLSQVDPLANSDEIARAWANLIMFMRAHVDINDLVLSETRRINTEDAADETHTAI